MTGYWCMEAQTHACDTHPPEKPATDVWEIIIRCECDVDSSSDGNGETVTMEKDTV